MAAAGTPELVVLAGPNGAGKSTFYETHLRRSGVRFVNADVIARTSGLNAYLSAELAGRLRAELVARRESFIFETVFSDPAGEKVEFLRLAAEAGYAVTLYFIGLDSALLSATRVAIRVAQGEHDVPEAKIMARFSRTLGNLQLAIKTLPKVLVFDNSDLANPYNFVAEYENGGCIRKADVLPTWFTPPNNLNRAMKTKRLAPAKPLLLGAHMSIADGASKAIDRALSIGASAMQIFVKNNMQWFAQPFAEAELREFVGHPRRKELKAVFGHSGYMINLGATNPDFHAKSLRALGEELSRADQLGLPFLVLHPGAHMGEGVEAGLAKITASLDAVLAALPSVKTRVALETTAGQGSSLGHTFEQLGWIFDHSAFPKRLCVCVDTAHLFAAGYDISTESGVRETFRKFDKVIGLRRLAAIHCNDSKTALGSRVDRHEHIGKGKIGLEAFRFLMRDSRFAGIPKVLETPKGKELAEDVENMALLRSLLEAD